MSATLKHDHVVRTADGAICRVRSVGKHYDHERGGYGDVDYADLVNLETNAELDLPVAELTRIPDPRNAKPPIDGLPEERPACQWCGEKLDPLVLFTRNDTASGPLTPRVRARTFNGWKGYGHSAETYTLGARTYYVPLFHSLGCAEKFATASHRGGYRRTG